MNEHTSEGKSGGPPVSDIERERLHRGHAKEIVDAVYGCGLLFRDLRAQGRDIPWIVAALWQELEADLQRFVTRDMFNSGAQTLLEALEALFAPEGAGAPQRLAAFLGEKMEQHRGDPGFTAGFMAVFQDRLAKLAGNPPARTAETQIRRALQAATSPLPDQTPAIQCCVMLYGMPISIQGALSETPEGGLRMLSPTDERNGKNLLMVEQFFDYEDVLVFVLTHEVEIEQSRIVRS